MCLRIFSLLLLALSTSSCSYLWKAVTPEYYELQLGLDADAELLVTHNLSRPAPAQSQELISPSQMRAWSSLQLRGWRELPFPASEFAIVSCTFRDRDDLIDFEVFFVHLPDSVTPFKRKMCLRTLNMLSRVSTRPSLLVMSGAAKLNQVDDFPDWVGLASGDLVVMADQSFFWECDSVSQKGTGFIYNLKFSPKSQPGVSQ